jgi:hypothetical protein
MAGASQAIDLTAKLLLRTEAIARFLNRPEVLGNALAI